MNTAGDRLYCNLLFIYHHCSRLVSRRVELQRPPLPRETTRYIEAHDKSLRRSLAMCGIPPELMGGERSGVA